MHDILGVIVALIVAVIVLWLLKMVVPVWIAALIALGLFLVIVTGNLRLPGR